MSATGMQGHEFDFEKWRLRRFVDKLIDIGEMKFARNRRP